MRMLYGLFFSAIFIFVFDPSTEASAYLDPGTGSMVLQLLLGGVAGAVVVVKLYWEKVKDFLFGKNSPNCDE